MGHPIKETYESARTPASLRTPLFVVATIVVDVASSSAAAISGGGGGNSYCRTHKALIVDKQGLNEHTTVELCQTLAVLAPSAYRNDRSLAERARPV